MLREEAGQVKAMIEVAVEAAKAELRKEFAAKPLPEPEAQKKSTIKRKANKS